MVNRPFKQESKFANAVGKISSIQHIFSQNTLTLHYVSSHVNVSCLKAIKIPEQNKILIKKMISFAV